MLASLLTLLLSLRVAFSARRLAIALHFTYRPLRFSDDAIITPPFVIGFLISLMSALFFDFSARYDFFD